MRVRFIILIVAGALVTALAATRPAGSAQVLFQDGFASQEGAEAWQFVDEGDLGAPSRWARTQGALVQFSNIAGDRGDLPGTYALAGDDSWTDYDFCFTVQSMDNDGIGAMLRFTAPDSYYRFRWTAEGSNWGGRVLERVSGGQWKMLASDKTGYVPNRRYQAALRVSGERIRLYIDDMERPVFDVTDAGTPVKRGKIALYSWDNAGVSFDNLSVTTPDHPFPPKLFVPPVLDVSGRVYEDGNLNGRRDAGERALKGVVVSDGLRAVKTDAAGRYRFSGVKREETRFVWVGVPSGWKASGSFHAALPDRSGAFEADFGLRYWPASSRTEFTFAQVTDIHVQGESGSMVEDMREVAAFRPDFAIASGDVVNHGAYREQLENYMRGVERSPVPVITNPGNHDLDGGWQNYEELLGPTYFSFDYGGVHFVLLNSVGEVARQMRWLREDLKHVLDGQPVIAVQHYPPTQAVMDALAGHNTLAIFSGHWHSSKVLDHKGILFVNSPPLRFGGIDCSPRGFVLAHVNRGKLTLEQRYAGVRRHLRIVHPAEGDVVAPEQMQIIAAAYDSASPAPAVEWSIDGREWRPLEQVGEMTYSASAPHLGAASHTLRVRADWGRGEPSIRELKFGVSPVGTPKWQSGVDWPAYKGNPGRTSAAGSGPEPPLRIAWSAPLGGVSHFASPVVAGGRAYVGVSDEEHQGGAGVAALDMETGQVLWRTPTTASVKNAVAVDNGRVFACSVDGTVWAMDAQTGKTLWTYRLGSGLQRWVFGAPVVSDGVVYAGVGPSFAALDSETGKEIWKAEEMAGDWISCLTSPAAGPDAVYMGTNWSNGLFAINRKTGKHIWNASDGFGNSHSSPAYAEGRVYHAANKALYCLDAATGDKVWEREIPGSWPVSSPAVSGGRVFLGLPGGALAAYKAADGGPLWQTQTGGPLMFFNPYDRDGSQLMSTPAVAGRFVWVGGVDGRLYAFDAASGEKVYSRDLGAPILSSAAVSGNSVLVTTYDGVVYRLAP